MVGQRGVLPSDVVGASGSDARAEPCGIAEVAMLCCSTLADEDTRSDISEREVRDGVAARLVEKDDIFAVGNPLASQFNAHPSAQGLSEQQSLWKRLGGKKAAPRRATQRALLPGEPHSHAPLVSPRRIIAHDDHV